MTAESGVEARQLRWLELPADTRALFGCRLDRLYGVNGDAAAIFDSLAPDKQQSLLIFLRRLLELKLWDAVERVENVYGEGGVGVTFIASPTIKSTLRGRADFTGRFSGHGGLGFMERRRRRASLHILESGGRNVWEAHFDLYNPWASVLGAWRHLLHEKILRKTPDWREVKRSLGY